MIGPDEQPARVAPARDGRRAGLSVGGRSPGARCSIASPRSWTATRRRSCCWSPAAGCCTREPPKDSRRRSSRARACRSGRGFAGRIVAERRAIVIPDVDHADILNPILREKGIRSLLGVPLLVEGRALGVLHVGSLTPREFTAEDQRAAPARRRPRGDRHRPRAPVRAGAQRAPAPGGAPARHRRRPGVPVRGRSAGRAARSRDRRAATPTPRRSCMLDDERRAADRPAPPRGSRRRSSRASRSRSGAASPAGSRPSGGRS